MTARQRAQLIALATAVVLVVAVLVVVSTRGGHGSHVVAGPNGPISGPSTVSTAGSNATVTTVDLLPVLPQTVVPTNPPVTVAPTTLGPTSTTSTTAPPALSGSGAVLVPPTSPDQRVLLPGASCQTLVDPGWSVQGCGAVRAKGVVLNWLTEHRSAGGVRAYVLGPGPANAQNVLLEAIDDEGARFSGVNVRVDSIGDGGEDLVFGFRSVGSGSVLSVDLVQGPGLVGVHRDLSHGAARSATGQLDTWSGVLAPGDANCCPSSFRHDTIHFTGGAWRVAAEVIVPTDAVPPSQL